MSFWKNLRNVKKKECGSAPKERWAYVGRARVKGYGNTYPWWVYLHPTDDEWYFINKSTGQAYPMGSFREWTRHFYFEGLAKPYGDRVKVTIDNNGRIQLTKEN